MFKKNPKFWQVQASPLEPWISDRLYSPLEIKSSGETSELAKDIKKKTWYWEILAQDVVN